MLSALILNRTWLPNNALGRTARIPEVRPSRSSRTREESPQNSAPATDRRPNCLTTFWTQLTCRFNGRTAQPLGPSPAPGCDEPTSRCQTGSSMWTLGPDQPVIPGVTFIRWSSTLLWAMVGSLTSAFATAWLVGLAVKPAFGFALSFRCPSGTSRPL